MAKVSRKVLREQVKSLYLAKVRDGLENEGEEVLLVGSNKLAIPVVDAEGNEDFITITISIPTGSRDDNEPYDGYGHAESYRLKLEENQRKAEVVRITTVLRSSSYSTLTVGSSAKRALTCSAYSIHGELSLRLHMSRSPSFTRKELVDERVDLLVRQILVDHGVVLGVDRRELRVVDLAVVREPFKARSDAGGHVVGDGDDLLLAFHLHLCGEALVQAVDGLLHGLVRDVSFHEPLY